MNALSLALRRELTRVFRELQREAQTRVVVLTGAGSAFCAGLDLKELGAASDPLAAVAPSADEDPVQAMSGNTGPIIGAINRESASTGSGPAS
jgi:enoyl-CoA hydratase